MAGGFRIQSIALEGFKGFTTRQEIRPQRMPRVFVGEEREWQVKHYGGCSLGIVWFNKKAK